MATEEDEQKPISFFRLFRFADATDILMMVLGTLSMLTLAVAIPLNIYLFGDLMTEYVEFDAPKMNSTLYSSNLSQCISLQPQRYAAGDDQSNIKQAMETLVIKFAIAFSINGVVGFLVAYLGITLWKWTGERQILRIRTAYFQAIMKQSVGWFDVNDAAQINSRMVENIGKLSGGFGESLATFIQWVATSVFCFLMSLLVEWKLALVVLTAGPFIVIASALHSRFTRRLAAQEQAAYAKAGVVAEETFSSMPTVAAFGGEKKALEKYAHKLKNVLEEGSRKAKYGASNLAFSQLMSFSTFALSLWYGATLVREECADAGAILQVYYGVLMGSIYLGYAIPQLTGFSNARAAAAVLFHTIDSAVAIDSWSTDGLRERQLNGDIEFKDVKFSFPTRPESKVLNGLSLSVKKGQTVALVGETGCGKTTTIQLIQRFYETDEGKILVDGKELHDYNLTWLRDQMGIVSQEPVLFATTIRENIRLGAKWGDEVTQQEIEEAAKQANCYDFITNLPEGFETLVGERGAQLSAGQKQRVAIARALVRNPPILLLDEATSSLDTRSEAVVQDALDKAREGRTTIVIAHRLSTVRGADQILALKDGQVHEQGSHEDLMSMRGIYYSLVMRQLQEKKQEEEGPSTSDESIGEQMSAALGTEPVTHHGHGRSEEIEMKEKREDMETDQLLAEVEPPKEVPIKRMEILKMNKPEWHLITLGAFGSFLRGTIQLGLAMVMSEVVGKLSEPNPLVQKAEMNKFCIYILLIGVGAALAAFLQNVFLALSGERMSLRLRKLSFSAIVKQDMAYFDDPNNAVGSLTSILSLDATQVKGATGLLIGIVVQCTTTLVGVVLISFLYVWELALCALIFMPLMIGSGKVQQALSSGYARLNKEGVVEGGKMAQETISNMRTVTSLNRQKYFTEKFAQHFTQLYRADSRRIFSHGIAYGAASSMLFFLHAFCFGIGGYFAICDCLPWREGRIPLFYILRVFTVITFGCMDVGRAIPQLPDYTTAKLAATRIKRLLERRPSIDASSTEGAKVANLEGEICFDGVEFCYPNRKAVQVLQGVSFTVKKKSTVALVGSSGCGKTTSIALLERFYDSLFGTVTIDGRDIKSLNISWLRHQLGLVSQEPILFHASIAENIAYGDNSREVQMSEIIEAATKANAHNFITSLPQGYETDVGAKGTQLSGGQKQRIAIARALVRKPAILLLDEATSALDTESEKVVQQALDEAAHGRTTIIIAHRLSTIRNADQIGVIDGGKVVEFGTHEQLLEQKGAYHALVNGQMSLN